MRLSYFWLCPLAILTTITQTLLLSHLIQANHDFYHAYVPPSNADWLTCMYVVVSYTANSKYVHVSQSNMRTSVSFRAYCPNDLPQQWLCGYNVQTYSIVIKQYASAIVAAVFWWFYHSQLHGCNPKVNFCVQQPPIATIATYIHTL